MKYLPLTVTKQFSSKTSNTIIRNCGVRGSDPASNIGTISMVVIFVGISSNLIDSELKRLKGSKNLEFVEMMEMNTIVQKRILINPE